MAKLSDIHVFIHGTAIDEEASTKIREILLDLQARLRDIQDKGSAVTQELENLKREVQESTSINRSAVTLLAGLSERLRAVQDDPQAIQALADELDSSSNELADAVAANTTGDRAKGISTPGVEVSAPGEGGVTEGGVPNPVLAHVEGAEVGAPGDVAPVVPDQVEADRAAAEAQSQAEAEAQPTAEPQPPAIDVTPNPPSSPEPPQTPGSVTGTPIEDYDPDAEAAQAVASEEQR